MCDDTKFMAYKVSSLAKLFWFALNHGNQELDGFGQLIYTLYFKSHIMSICTVLMISIHELSCAMIIWSHSFC